MLYDIRKQELNAVYVELQKGYFLVQETKHNTGNSWNVTSLCIGK